MSSLCINISTCVCLFLSVVIDRVAQDRRERIGETVGYAVSTERNTGPVTRLLFATAGTLQQHIVHQHTIQPFTHVILDEVHEREVEVRCCALCVATLMFLCIATATAQTDFLFVLLKEAMTLFPHIKLIVMSATLNSQLFANYFTDINGKPGSGCCLYALPSILLTCPCVCMLL